MKNLIVWTRSHRPATGSRAARVIGSQLAALLVAVLVNPPPAALQDVHLRQAAAPARDTGPEDRR